ncbi:MAG: hypothetical protein HOP13_00400 [Alphaproteobacteria bacterium]|nr:hypothetical protein [Alphaproteobacteria bacterium]
MTSGIPQLASDLRSALKGRKIGAQRPRTAALVSWRKPFLRVLGALVAVLIACALFITAVDPYDNYPWGFTPKLERQRYNPRAVPWLLNTLVKSDYDTYLIGGSTVSPFVAADIERELTGTRKAFVVGYLAPRPRDLVTVFRRIGQAKSVRRIIVAFDISYLHPPEVARREFPFALYDDDVANDLRAFGIQALRLSVRMLTGQEYHLNDWDIARDNASFEDLYRRSLSPETVRSIRRKIEEYKPYVLNPSPHSCENLPAVNALNDFARTMAARGVRVDILIPPFSYYVYYDWLNPKRAPYRLTNAPLTTLIASRRCLLAALDGAPGTRVFAYDLRPEIVEDMANYRDSAHIHGTELGKHMLEMINRGEGLLTLATFDDYASQLSARVKNYTYRNSKLDAGR